MDFKSYFPEAITAIITAVITYFSTKRKYKAESASLEYQNVQMILSTYRTELESMKTRINDYVRKINELERRVDNLLHENISLKGELGEFKKNTK